jgi:hypothetical protein
MRTYTLSSDHPAVTDPQHCPFCENAFQAGDETTLVAKAPASAEDKQRMLAGRPYMASCLLMHVECVSAMVSAPAAS